MAEYQIYIPSAEGYAVFRENTKKENRPTQLKREEDFLKEFYNTRIKERVITLNAYYNTRISHSVLDKIISNISQMNFEEELSKDDNNLVEKLRYSHGEIKKGDKPVDYLSFASKYCHHCNPDKYPIHDGVNVRVLSVLFGYKDKRNYDAYVECFKDFCSFLGVELKGKEGFYIDKYIQAIGHRDNELLFK